MKENEVGLEPKTAGTSPACPQHHFTALRDVGEAHSQPFRRDSTGQDVGGDLGRGRMLLTEITLFPFPPQRGLLQTEMTSGCSKRGKLGQLSVL